MRLFGTSGIRGTLEEMLGPENSAKIGLAIATFFGEGSTLLVGRDNRVQSQPVALSVISGLISGGVNVVDLGMVPTPALLYTLKDLKLDGAIIVTGSHALPEITGILVFKADTSELDKGEEEAIEEAYFNNKLNRVPWNRVGWIETYEDALEHYAEHVLSRIRLSLVEGERVVIDPGNGVMSGFLHRILVMAGIKVYSMNDIIDPTFPVRDPYPRPENLEELAKITVASNSTLGVGTDGDGDRAIFSDERGRVLWGDITGAIFAMDAIKRFGKKEIVAPVNTSIMAELAIQSVGGKLVYSPIGPPAIVSKMKEIGAEFGFEESGKYIWREAIWYGDAALATLRLLEIINKSGKPLSAMADELPRFKLVKIAIRCKNGIKKKVLEKATEILKERFKSQAFRIIGIDGSKFVFEDNKWLLVRPSGTEPIFRVFAEASSEEEATKLAKIGETVVKEVIKELS